MFLMDGWEEENAQRRGRYWVRIRPRVGEDLKKKKKDRKVCGTLHDSWMDVSVWWLWHTHCLLIHPPTAIRGHSYPGCTNVNVCLFSLLLQPLVNSVCMLPNKVLTCDIWQFVRFLFFEWCNGLLTDYVSAGVNKIQLNLCSPEQLKVWH